MMNSRAAIACAIGALLAGCASISPTRDAGSSGPAPSAACERAERGNPALVFATPEMRQMLARRGLPPGFGGDDWEYGRNDQRLSVGASRVYSTWLSAFEITQSDYLYDTDGRPRNSNRTTVRSVRSGGSQ